MLKPGTKVKLKDSLKVTKKYGGVEFPPVMAKDMKDKIFTIEMPLEFTQYTVKEFGYVVTEEMVEVVEDAN